jgi:hypothetical protein
MTDLFSEAARDVDAERLTERCALAKVAVADVWTFLALAQSPSEFEHRLALAHSHIAAKVDPDLMEFTLAGLKADFVELHDYRAQGGPQKVASAVADETRTAAMQPGQQFWHSGQRRWITVQAADLPHQPDTRDNPYGQGANYFENAAEEGPNTGQTGQYPQFPAGPDPVSPLQASWVERPMQLSPGAGQKSGSRPGDLLQGRAGVAAQSAAAKALTSVGYAGPKTRTGSGSNPDFFGAGSEGVGGDPQNAYPQDLAVEDPDDRVNELYGAVPPQQSSGSGMGGAQPYSNPAVSHEGVLEQPFYHGDPVRMTEQYTDPASAHAQNRTRYVTVPAGYTTHALSSPMTDEHGTWVNIRHPEAVAGYVQVPADRVERIHQTGVRHTAPGGGEHAPYRLEEGDGGWYVVNDKGERKNSRPKSKDQARQYQKALYANVPGARESAEEDEHQKSAAFFDPSDIGVHVTAQGPDGMDSSGAGMPPQPPQSMTPGGVGSVAQPPLSADPGMGDDVDPGGADAANKTPQMVANRLAEIARVAADNIRQRPTDWNPSGVADEYDERTWEGGVNTRPRQPAEDRGINTPQTPRDPIPQTSSSEIQRELSEDEERLRQGRRLQFEQQLISQVAARVARNPIVMAGGVR